MSCWTVAVVHLTNVLIGPPRWSHNVHLKNFLHKKGYWLIGFFTEAYPNKLILGRNFDIGFNQKSHYEFIENVQLQIGNCSATYLS